MANEIFRTQGSFHAAFAFDSKWLHQKKVHHEASIFPKERIFPGLLVINYARLFSRVVVISKYEMRFRIRLNVNKKGKEEEESVCVCVEWEY